MIYKRIILASALLIPFSLFAQEMVQPPLPPLQPATNQQPAPNMQPPPQQGASSFPNGFEPARPSFPQQSGQNSQPPFPTNRGEMSKPPQAREEQGHFKNEDKEDFQDYLDPREFNEAFRQIKDIRREAGRLIKKGKKLQGAEATVSSLEQMLLKLTEHESLLKNADKGSQREALEEFHDLRIWESIETARLQIQFPE